MKRTIGWLVGILMVLTAVGCGEEPTVISGTNTTVATASTAAVTEEAQSGEEAPSAATAVNTTATTASLKTTAAPTTVTVTASTTVAVTSAVEPMTTKTTTKPTTAKPPVLTASLTVRGANGDDESAVSESRKFRLCDSLFSFPVYLKADGDVAAVDVYELELSFENGMYTRGDKKGQLGGMKDGDSAIVWLEFPGDFSAWCVTYSTANGAQKDLSMYLSGEDGSLIVQEGIM